MWEKSLDCKRSFLVQVHPAFLRKRMVPGVVLSLCGRGEKASPGGDFPLDILQVTGLGRFLLRDPYRQAGDAMGQVFLFPW